MPKLLVKGGKRLAGEVKVSGSKNAALPILAATLLTDEPCTIKNVPDIADVKSMIHLLELLGAKIHFANNTVIIHTSKIKQTAIEAKEVGKFRASILLLGPLLSRKNEVKMAFPGGCILGKRSIHAHLHAMGKFGCSILDKQNHIHIKRNNPVQPVELVMSEPSVTATENAIMMAVIGESITELRLAACEPHVQDLCKFLNKMGARIKGIGTHTLIIRGVKRLRGTTYPIRADYLEAGALALAAILTKGEVTIKGIESHDLDAFWNKLDEVGVKVEKKETQVTIKPAKNLKAIEKLQTAVYPGFPTDLQAPFAVLLTQAEGESFIFETLFESRLNYLFELEKMGAKINILNPHQARIQGPTLLRGVPVASCDIRAGTAMVLAALIAEGETEISHVYYIDRGYDRLDEKLKMLGADIQRITE